MKNRLSELSALFKSSADWIRETVERYLPEPSEYVTTSAQRTLTVETPDGEGNVIGKGYLKATKNQFGTWSIVFINEGGGDCTTLNCDGHDVTGQSLENAIIILGEFERISAENSGVTDFDAYIQTQGPQKPRNHIANILYHQNRIRQQLLSLRFQLDVMGMDAEYRSVFVDGGSPNKHSGPP